MKQLTIISGKGGTGKTTITAAFASLAEKTTLADCDVDAADLQLVLSPEVNNEEPYYGSATAMRMDECSMCGKCRDVCRFNAVDEDFNITEMKCEGCGACAFVCPDDVIETKQEKTGTVFESATRFGQMIHAELEIGEEASGKMVTQVRNKAQDRAGEDGLLLIDGSPGIGCPVIASIKGVDQVLLVAEPTVSGIHDLKRVFEVASHFGIRSQVCINKFDLNSEKTEEIEGFCEENGISIVGKLPYDDGATRAMIEEKTVIEHSNSELAQRIGEMWRRIESSLER